MNVAASSTGCARRARAITRSMRSFARGIEAVPALRFARRRPGGQHLGEPHGRLRRRAHLRWPRAWRAPSTGCRRLPPRSRRTWRRRGAAAVRRGDRRQRPRACGHRRSRARATGRGRRVTRVCPPTFTARADVGGGADGDDRRRLARDRAVADRRVIALTLAGARRRPGDRPQLVEVFDQERGHGSMLVHEPARAVAGSRPATSIVLLRLVSP